MNSAANTNKNVQLTTGVSKLSAVGHIQPASCFYMTHELKMVLQFWMVKHKSNKEDHFMSIIWYSNFSIHKYCCWLLFETQPPTRSFVYILCLALSYNGSVEELWQRLYTLQSQTYLLPAFYRKTLPDPIILVTNWSQRKYNIE